MFDPVKDADKVSDLLDNLNINLEVSQQCLNALKHLDDSAVSFQDWCEIRRGVMLLVTQVGQQVDNSLIELREVL